MDEPISDDDELTCRELVELVTDYLEHALAAPERARFEAHLAECDGCRDYLHQMQRTITVLGRPTPQTLSAAERARLLTLFRGLRGS
jgi:predicted anti-sigma-YlaC factor YlaD